MRFSVLAFAAACQGSDGPATGVVTQASSCTSTDIYSRSQPPSRPAHTIFCGNVVKEVWGDSPIGQCSGGSCCLGQAQTQDPSGNGIPSTDRAEVRGWVHHITGYHDAENSENVSEEYIFELRLDLDWDASPCLPSNVTPINNLTRFAHAFTPYNGFPGPTLGADFALGGNSPDIHPTVKVEVNGYLPLPIIVHGDGASKPRTV